MLMYYYQNGLYIVTESNFTKAISTIYKNCFNTSICYLRYQAMGWNDENILKILKRDIQYILITINLENHKIFIYGIGFSLCKKWRYVGLGFQTFLLHIYERKQSIFIL